MSKKGVTLVELLGAIVLFAIILGVVASITSIILNQSDQITEKSLANSKATLIKETIENDLEKLSLTSDEDCINTNCVILKSEFQYVISTDDIIKMPNDPIIIYRIEVINQELFINNAKFDLNPFTFSAIDITLTKTIDTYKLSLSFTLDGKTDDFQYQFFFNHPIIK